MPRGSWYFCHCGLILFPDFDLNDSVNIQSKYLTLMV